MRTITGDRDHVAASDPSDHIDEEVRRLLVFVEPLHRIGACPEGIVLLLANGDYNKLAAELGLDPEPAQTTLDVVLHRMRWQLEETPVDTLPRRMRNAGPPSIDNDVRALFDVLAPYKEAGAHPADLVDLVRQASYIRLASAVGLTCSHDKDSLSKLCKRLLSELHKAA